MYLLLLDWSREMVLIIRLYQSAPPPCHHCWPPWECRRCQRSLRQQQMRECNIEISLYQNLRHRKGAAAAAAHSSWHTTNSRRNSRSRQNDGSGDTITTCVIHHSCKCDEAAARSGIFNCKISLERSCLAWGIAKFSKTATSSFFPVYRQRSIIVACSVTNSTKGPPLATVQYERHNWY